MRLSDGRVRIVRVGAPRRHGGILATWVDCSTESLSPFVLRYISVASLGLAAQATAAKGAPKAAALKNPVASTPASIAAGQACFKKYCRFCHGEDAKGDGPQAPKDTHPPNLTDEKWDHGSTDAEIFTAIKDGIGPKFDMKGYNSKLTPQEMWNIVNYLRSLAPATPLTVAASPRCHRFRRQVLPLAAALLVVLAAVGACRGADATAARVGLHAGALVRGAAVNDFFNIRPDPQQPFPFPHNTHVDKKMMCTEYCHESVAKGPIAGLPSVKTCMICHESIATDRPLIKTVADYAKRGIDISWQRVYRLRRGVARAVQPRAAHPRQGGLRHLPRRHRRSRPLPQRNVDLNMGFCVECHKSRQASNECLTCHF